MLFGAVSRLLCVVETSHTERKFVYRAAKDLMPVAVWFVFVYFSLNSASHCLMPVKQALLASNEANSLSWPGDQHGTCNLVLFVCFGPTAQCSQGKSCFC